MENALCVCTGFIALLLKFLLPCVNKYNKYSKQNKYLFYSCIPIEDIFPSFILVKKYIFIFIYNLEIVYLLQEAKSYGY